ncbi:MAG: CTP synthase [Acholeplasmataceae bacterium]
MTKYIFVTGGVVSGIGKGISAAAIGQILKRHGYKVSMQKLDPYLNVDPGTMSPFQHGEVFVTQDGQETDLDLGHYERFIDEYLTKDSSVTSGQIYEAVINKERRGVYLGHTVQVIPHVTDMIKEKLHAIAHSSNADIIIIEIGGTVGDIESLPFIEAIRQFRRDIGYNQTYYLHTTLIPYIHASGEYKTKPTQHSLKELRSLGIHADGVLLRSDAPLNQSIIDKVALLGDMDKSAVFTSHDVDVLYEVIINYHKQQLTTHILNHFNLEVGSCDISPWEALIQKMKHTSKTLNIAMVGKYVGLHDAYFSLIEALEHAGYEAESKVNIVWIDAEDVEKVENKLQAIDGIVVPGGFGVRATEGKIKAIKYAREHRIPFLGICFGMQLAVVEFSRNVLGLEGAHSTELDPESPHPVIDIQRGRIEGEDLGGTLRLGASETHIQKDTLMHHIYQKDVILERHRHRFEVNPKYHKAFQGSEMMFSSYDASGTLAESAEIKNHPFFIGVQYHPEFLSRPLKPHPLFLAFIRSMNP